MALASAKQGLVVMGPGSRSRRSLGRDDSYQATNPFIGFAAALSGNTVSASTRSLKPR